MTDPEFADATYIEPITAEVVEEIIARELPDALLPTLGGQTALNVTMALHRRGTLERFRTQLIGAGIEAIERAEDRGRFKVVMEQAGLAVPRAAYATSMDEAIAHAEKIGYPVMVRPSFILGGGGTGIASDPAEFVDGWIYDSDPNNIGHEDFLGCFRCHDDNHKSADGRVISQDCETCHTILAQEETDPKILSDLGLK